MLPGIVDALRRADRSMFAALALALLFTAAAGALVPHTGKSAIVTKAPLPLQLEAATPVAAIMNPALLVVHTASIDLSPLLQQLMVQKMLAEQRCLAEAMYYEARGEGEAGEKAIAEVVFHRMRARGYPGSVCGVIYQGVTSGRGCQFSFACNGELLQARRGSAWTRARRLAASIMSGVVRLGDQTGDAISFHAIDVEPDWNDRLVKTVQIGNHVFYRSALHARSS